jgi:hypothetical protein
MTGLYTLTHRIVNKSKKEMSLTYTISTVGLTCQPLVFGGSVRFQRQYGSRREREGTIVIESWSGKSATSSPFPGEKVRGRRTLQRQQWQRVSSHTMAEQARSP